MKKIRAAIAIIEKDKRYLITQRKPDDTFALYWEFPGGKCEKGETLEECVVREIKEEVGIIIRVLEKGDVLVSEIGHHQIVLHSFHCSYVSGKPAKLECHDFRWVKADELPQYQFPPANDQLIQKLIDQQKNREN